MFPCLWFAGINLLHLSLMKRVPINEITIENYQEVYRDYQEYRVHPLVPKLGHMAVRQLFRPDVYFESGAKEHIESQSAKGNPMIMTSNHVRYIDHFIIGAAWQRDKALRGFINNTMVYAKAPYFTESKSKWMTELIGGVPVWRDRDFTPEQFAEIGRLFGSAALSLMAMSLEQLKMGRNAFLFPEGTRNTGDWNQVSSLQPGVGHLAAKAWHIDELKDVSVIPTGIAYRTDSQHNWFKPTIYVGEPLVRDGCFMYPNPIVRELEKRMQHSVDLANVKLKDAA